MTIALDPTSGKKRPRAAQYLTRAAACYARAHVNGGSAARIARYLFDDRVTPLVVRAATTPRPRVAMGVLDVDATPSADAVTLVRRIGTINGISGQVRCLPQPSPVTPDLAPGLARLVGSTSQLLLRPSRRGLAVRERAEGCGGAPARGTPRGSGAPGGRIYPITAGRVGRGQAPQWRAPG
jgi:hypothetical protein